MKLIELLTDIVDCNIINNKNIEIEGIAFDSRDVKKGDLFVAIKGNKYDGHNYIESAFEKGAVAILAEKNIPKISSLNPYVIVADSRKAMGKIAAKFYNYPSREMALIGVTGTSGKTTVTHLISYILYSAEIKNGLIGTLGIKIEDEYISSKHTTPESLDIQRHLHFMKNEGVKAVVMEASSHGLYLGRLIGCEFDRGVFTNIARDHLDFHKTESAYLAAKMILFNDLPRHANKEFIGIINIDDNSSETVIKNCVGDILTFGIKNKADFNAVNINATEKEVSFKLLYKDLETDIEMPIGGYFNVYNALSAIATAVSLGIDIEYIRKGLKSAKPVAGRFESIDCGQSFGVLVDYAHTPDELENVLMSAKKLTNGRLISVFGCGGDRDRGKRPIMGKIAEELSDLVIVTSDNPRTEDPNEIINEILEGIHNKEQVIIESDRYNAIKKAIINATEGDCIVIAGKGHEDYQIFANETIHFDDREVVREILMETKSNESN